jgi:hypothetical protein
MMGAKSWKIALKLALILNGMNKIGPNFKSTNTNISLN